ncbi:hypothetical protein [Pseudomonas triticicola]|uniref:hypothetical protein n=1 Tax=Pseudomonas triticicola TaxID=2842345 RepID=UPI003EBC3872
MAGSCSKAIGGVADVRSLALNEEVMKVAATNGYKKATQRRQNPASPINRVRVGAAAGCDLLTLVFLNQKQDQKIAAFGSAYMSGAA